MLFHIKNFDDMCSSMAWFLTSIYHFLSWLCLIANVLNKEIIKMKVRV